MIVPQYWAESRVQHRQAGRQITLRRFGWSDVSQADAQALADERARTALQRAIDGDKIERRERKVPYNGAQGVPIREEIVSRHGDVVITRNAYGARCLNTPKVFFADIDHPNAPPLRLTLTVIAVLMLAALIAALLLHSRWVGIGVAVLALFTGGLIAKGVFRMQLRVGGGVEARARSRVARFVAQHPQWHLRLYRTPAGMRVMAMHRTFEPHDPEVAECFRALDVDPLYARMCLNQNCFRARVSAKPWRIGIGRHMRPRPGVWPVAAQHRAVRDRWIADYEHIAHGFSACAFIESIGSGAVNLHAKTVQELHDDLCGANTTRPMA